MDLFYSPAGGWCHAMPGNMRTGAGVAHRPDHPEGRCSSPESVAHPHMHTAGDLAELTRPCLSCPSGDSLDSVQAQVGQMPHPDSTPWCSACAGQRVAQPSHLPTCHLHRHPRLPPGHPVASSAVTLASGSGGASPTSPTPAAGRSAAGSHRAVTPSRTLPRLEPRVGETKP